MAVAHNLTSITDNLSGFDPVNGITDGTTIGNQWIMWKLFEGLSAFDTTIKKITNASPTPTFLQGSVGSGFQTEPAQNANGTGTLRFYKTNDAGLSQTPASAIICEWNDGGSYASLFFNYFRYLIDGGALYSPSTTNTVQNGAVSQNSVYYNGWTTTGTVNANVPKVIFWKSSNANCLMAINKNTGAYQGCLIWFTPVISGYKHTVGAITQGLHSNFIVSVNVAGGTHYMEGIAQQSEGSSTVIGNSLSPLCSAGILPSSVFTFSSVNNLIGGKLRFAVNNDSTFKIISEEIEGVLLVNPSAASAAVGQISQFNSTYYLNCGNISDGRVTHKILLELGT